MFEHVRTRAKSVCGIGSLQSELVTPLSIAWANEATASVASKRQRLRLRLRVWLRLRLRLRQRLWQRQRHRRTIAEDDCRVIQEQELQCRCCSAGVAVQALQCRQGGGCHTHTSLRRMREVFYDSLVRLPLLLPSLLPLLLLLLLPLSLPLLLLLPCYIAMVNTRLKQQHVVLWMCRATSGCKLARGTRRRCCAEVWLRCGTQAGHCA